MTRLHDKEQQQGYHQRCLKKMFGTPRVPHIDLDESTIQELAQQSTAHGITVAGVQKKLSLHLHSDKSTDPRLTLVGYPQGYLLKPQSADFAFLPESEQLVMTMADAAGIQTVPHALIRLADNTLAYITKRTDRSSDAGKIPMEDFCQLSERLTEDKYKGSYEQCAKIINRFSDKNGLDLSEFFYRLLFCFVTGNSDMHLKNFSLIKNPATGEWSLSRAYDLLPVHLILPGDTEETALTLDGKKSCFRRTHFLSFAQTVHIPEKAAEKMIAKVCAQKEKLMHLAKCGLLPKEMQEAFTALIAERIERLE